MRTKAAARKFMVVGSPDCIFSASSRIRIVSAGFPLSKARTAWVYNS